MYYLKYRPKTISEIDNSRVKDLLKKILQEKEIPHALLFVGQKGTGKTSAARIFSKSINCLENKFAHAKTTKGGDFEPCNRCANCLSISRSSFTDVIEMDAASNRGIEEVKNLIKETAYLPMSGRYRVFIIDEAHMITSDGFNALLKTLEEPPSSAVFILATTNLEKLPKTIVSRCLKINFGRGRLEDIISMLKRISLSEKLSFDNKILTLIAQHSDFSFRDAAKILEEFVIQNIKTREDAMTFIGLLGRGDLLAIIESANEKKVFEWIEEFSQNGGNFKSLVEDLLEKLRIQLLLKKGVKNEFEEKSNLTVKQISYLIRLLLKTYQLERSTPIESLPIEIAMSEYFNQN